MTQSGHTRPNPWLLRIEGACDEHAPSLRCDLAARAADAWRVVRIHRRHRVRRVLQIGPQVVRCPTREAADVRIFDDRLVEVDQRRIDQRQGPAVVLARILARRARCQAIGHGAIERHVVLLVRVHGEVIERTDAAEDLLRAEPGVLGRPQILPGDFQIGIIGVPADVDADATEVLAVDIDERVPCGSWRLAGHVGTVVDAIEVDGLAVVADPFSVSAAA